jgi:hypothetical protein
LEGSRLDQEAIGWLCPDFENGYKEVGVNFWCHGIPSVNTATRSL